MLKKIVILGPESTGKSTLCALLANYYNSDWVPEYAREYLTENGTAYTVDDLWKIAEGQLAAENKLLNSIAADYTSPVFFDTDLYVIKVWSEFVFGSCDNRILTAIADRKYDGYLLCNTDLPWTKDELREYPDINTRERLFYHYKDLLVNQDSPWSIISGIGKERLLNAIGSVNKMLNY